MNKRVLIADDSEFMRQLLSEILSEEYDIVGVAENGVEAVDLYESTQPDIVVMDDEMPIKNGIDAARAILEDDPNASVVLCPKIGVEEQITEAREAGAATVLTKPFQKPNVLQAIEQTI